ncbi:hypothetical protein [Scytonema sp. NUACC21]
MGVNRLIDAGWQTILPLLVPILYSLFVVVLSSNASVAFNVVFYNAIAAG